MKFSVRAVKVIGTLLGFAAVGVILYVGSRYLQPAAGSTGAGSGPGPLSSPSTLPPPGPGGAFSEAAQTDATWARQTFSGYSEVTAPVKTASGWTFTLRGTGQIYSPSQTDLCTNASLNKSTYTRKLYGHLVTVTVSLPNQSHGSVFTVVTAPLGSRREPLHCS